MVEYLAGPGSGKKATPEGSDLQEARAAQQVEATMLRLNMAATSYKREPGRLQDS